MGSIQVVIKGVGRQVKQYPNRNNSNLLSFQEYIELAHKYVKILAPALFHQFTTSEDAQSFIAELLMIGDWGYIEGKGTSRETWRTENAKKAIIELYKSSNRKKNRKLEPIEFDIPEQPKIISENIKRDEDKRKIEFFLNNSGLTDKQIEYVKDAYLYEMSNGEIAQKNGVSRQAVEDTLKNALGKMRRCSRVL